MTDFYSACLTIRTRAMKKYYARKMRNETTKEAVLTFVRLNDDSDGLFQVPEGIVVIGKGAFENCINLASVILPSSLKVIRENAFSNCSKLTSIEIPEGVVSIGMNAFGDCKELTSVLLPPSLKDLGEAAFEGCRKLRSIDIPEGVTVIPRRCFCNTFLKQVHLPTSLEKIDEKAFCNCYLKQIVIPNNVEAIGDYSFWGNYAESIYVGDSLNRIGKNAFFRNDPSEIIVSCHNCSFCDAECNVIMTVEDGKILFGASNSRIPKKATSIANGAFSFTPDVFIIPSSINIIETAAFCNFYDGDKTIILQEGVKQIKWGAFQTTGDHGFTVYIPSSVTQIEGQFSTVDFHLDAANKNYKYDIEGQNIISKEGNLVWGRLLNGIPSKGVLKLSLLPMGLSFHKIVIPKNVCCVEPSTISYFSGVERLIMSKGVVISPIPAIEWSTGCEIEKIVDEKMKGNGVIKKQIIIIPANTNRRAIIEAIGDASLFMAY